jgi:hypothetical protein
MCPYKYFLKYMKRIKKTIEPEHFRYGTNWHRIMEVVNLKPGKPCDCGSVTENNQDCLVCGGTGYYGDDPMMAAARVIDDAYSRIPVGMDPVKWAVERAKLLYSAAGYVWYYSDDPFNPVHCEQKFKTAIPGKTGRSVPNVKVVGMIDKVVTIGACNRVVEHKTTSNPIDSGSKYWGKLSLDTQTSLYILIAKMLQAKGELPEVLGEIDGLFYDVFHKPTISPKQLKMSDGKKFVEDGMYFEQHFEVVSHIFGEYTVDGYKADVEPGAKEGQFKLRETPDMYGARLLADIAERPEFYFARKEIGKTDDEINRFHKQLLGILASLRAHDKDDSWYQCEDMCEATFHCEYIDICYNGIDPDGVLPEGLEVKEKREEK